MSHTRRILRNYLCIQFVVLLLTLGALGVLIAAERTQFAAYGAPAAAQRESALELEPSALRDAILPDEPVLQRLLSYAAALPAPVGCVVALVGCVRDWLGSGTEPFGIFTKNGTR